MGRPTTNIRTIAQEFRGEAGHMLLVSLSLQFLASGILFTLPIYSEELQSYYNIPAPVVTNLVILQVVLFLPGKRSYSVHLEAVFMQLKVKLRNQNETNFH